MFIKSIILSLALLSGQGIAHANSANGSHELLAVVIHDSGHLLVSLGGSSNTEGCATSGTEKLVLFRKDNPNFKLFYSMLLTALATGRQVEGWVNGCTELWGAGSTRVVTGTTLSIAK
ncbi:MAG: hypothetical protein IV107_25170 [Paucibacter sp.]|nr:hypothetical protein [Roseateles sp.]